MCPASINETCNSRASLTHCVLYSVIKEHRSLFRANLTFSVDLDRIERTNTNSSDVRLWVGFDEELIIDVGDWECVVWGLTQHTEPVRKTTEGQDLSLGISCRKKLNQFQFDGIICDLTLGEPNVYTLEIILLYESNRRSSQSIVSFSLDLFS